MVFQLSHCASVQFPFVVILSYTLRRSLFVSFRKPRPVSQLVAQQVNQQFAPPPHKKEKKERSDRSEKEVALRRKSSKKMRYRLRPSPLDAGVCHISHSVFFFPLFFGRPRLKNIDRSSARHLEVTVGDLTVIITDFKEKVKPVPTSASAASADQHSQSSSGSDNTE